MKKKNRKKDTAYVSPSFEVIEMVPEQNILAASSESLPDFYREDW